MLVLAFIFVFKLGDSMATALSTAFYLDLGFTKTEVGVIGKNVGLWSSVVGGLIGGAWLVKLGIDRGLWIFGALQLVAIFGFAWLAKAGPDRAVLAFAIGFEAFASVGLGTAAFTAFIARTTDPRYTATQFALFTSLAVVPRTFANAGAGYHRRGDRLVRLLRDLRPARAARTVAVAEGRAVAATLGAGRRHGAVARRRVVALTASMPAVRRSKREVFIDRSPRQKSACSRAP